MNDHHAPGRNARRVRAAGLAVLGRRARRPACDFPTRDFPTRDFAARDFAAYDFCAYDGRDRSHRAGFSLVREQNRSWDRSAVPGCRAGSAKSSPERHPVGDNAAPCKTGGSVRTSFCALGTGCHPARNRNCETEFDRPACQHPSPQEETRRGHERCQAGSPPRQHARPECEPQESRGAEWRHQ